VVVVFKLVLIQKYGDFHSHLFTI